MTTTFMQLLIRQKEELSVILELIVSFAAAALLKMLTNPTNLCPKRIFLKELTLLKQLLKECVSDMQTTNQIILKNKKIRFADYLVQCENAQMDALEHLDNIGSNWQVNRELRIRVGNDSKFQDYVGDLINFTIGAPDVSQFLKLKNSFNGLDMFSENIDPTCYHMEVHPLTSGKQSNKIQEKILENQKKCTKVFEKINEYVKGQAACAQITMVATRLHPLNNMAL